MQITVTTPRIRRQINTVAPNMRNHTIFSSHPPMLLVRAGGWSNILTLMTRTPRAHRHIPPAGLTIIIPPRVTVIARIALPATTAMASTGHIHLRVGVCGRCFERKAHARRIDTFVGKPFGSRLQLAGWVPAKGLSR